MIYYLLFLLLLQELYHELHALDRFEQDYRRRHQEEDNSNTTQRGNLLLLFPYKVVLSLHQHILLCGFEKITFILCFMLCFFRW